MPLMRHPSGRQAIVPDHAVSARQKRGWRSAGEQAAQRPATSATKAEWVDYAVAVGWDRDEAESMTKATLVGSLDG